MSFSNALNSVHLCCKGGFPTIKRNEIRDLIPSLCIEVCHEAQVEPILHLQLFSGKYFDHATLIKEDRAHLDASMTGIWGGRCETSYIDRCKSV